MAQYVIKSHYTPQAVVSTCGIGTDTVRSRYYAILYFSSSHTSSPASWKNPFRSEWLLFSGSY